MKLNYFKLALLALVSVCFMGFQCEKESDIWVPKRQFHEKVSLFPYKKAYNVGDTMWLQFQTTSKRLFDGVTSQYINTDTTFIQMTFQYQKRYLIPFGAGVDTFCYTITPLGLNQGLQVLQQYRADNYLNYATDCSTNYYFFKVGFIPRTPGIYSINNPSGEVTDCPSRLVRSPFSTVSFSFDLADCNKDIYLSIPAASRGESVKGQTEREIDNKKIFVFRVD